jgi:hypothetical protein
MGKATKAATFPGVGSYFVHRFSFLPWKLDACKYFRKTEKVITINLVYVMDWNNNDSHGTAMTFVGNHHATLH